MGNKRGTENIPLTDAELDLIKRVGRGDEPDDAGTTLFADNMARKVRKRTGKTPAKVYPIGRKTKDKDKP